ncbi:hypothetical protein P872_14020 [Rhodonellum psychrophilum GCM71 = DSM 17998]|uniref:Uncharacterized protein n=1 Tax=Rhodonellum psychrophilum GCM71 = DSM 17998 TaxID=1123057 RepID=U5BQK2_9BACT|nr:hypothetical protein P872_14020 [Rhodonellum psychrophilum GCM71 = DSM 17998]
MKGIKKKCEHPLLWQFNGLLRKRRETGDGRQKTEDDDA